MKLNDIETHADNATALLKSIASKPRLLVLCQLVRGECSVGGLLANTAISQSALSQHLAKLRAENIVATRKQAQTVFYRISNKSVFKLIKTLHSIYCE